MNGTDYLPEFPKFRNLAFEDKALLGTLFKLMQPQISELTFTNLFVWNEAEPVQLSRHDKTVLLKRKRIRDGKNLLLPSLTKRPIAAMLEDLKKVTVENQPEMLLYGIDAEQAKQISVMGYQVEPDRDDWDYVYLSTDLADLPGDKYHSKRNFITRCLSTYKCEYAKIDAQVVGDCLQLQTQWCNLRKCDAVPSLEAENKAIKTIFDNYRATSRFRGRRLRRRQTRSFHPRRTTQQRHGSHTLRKSQPPNHGPIPTHQPMVLPKQPQNVHLRQPRTRPRNTRPKKSKTQLPPPPHGRKIRRNHNLAACITSKRWNASRLSLGSKRTSLGKLQLVNERYCARLRNRLFRRVLLPLLDSDCPRSARLVSESFVYDVHQRLLTDESA